MRRIIILIIFAIAMISVPVFAQNGQPQVKVTIDGLSINFDVKPLIEDGRVLVPFRALSEGIGAQVQWDEKSQTVSAQHGNNDIQLIIGKDVALKNGVAIPLDVPPNIIDGRTLIPLRFFSEALGCQVHWNQHDYIVTITSPLTTMNVIGFYALGDRQTSSWTNLFKSEYPAASLGNTDIIRELALGWYSLDVEGNLLTRSRTGWQRPDGWENVLETTQKYHLKTDMVIHATDRDDLLGSFLNNPNSIKKLVADIMGEVPYYTGVNLNLEGLGLSQRGEDLVAVQKSFTNFVEILATQLNTMNKPLTVTLHAPNSSYKGYDYKALGEISDRILIMAYEYGQTPEPANMVIEAVEMALDLVPAHKLYLGINVPRETADSLLSKVGIAKRYNLQGIALWRLGVVTPEMWDNLRTSVQPRF